MTCFLPTLIALLAAANPNGLNDQTLLLGDVSGTAFLTTDPGVSFAPGSSHAFEESPNEVPSVGTTTAADNNNRITLPTTVLAHRSATLSLLGLGIAGYLLKNRRIPHME